MNDSNAFSTRTVFWAAFASLLAAAAFFLLSTYAPDFRLAGEGGPTPLSKSGVGYAGIAKLLGLTGEAPIMARDEAQLDEDALLIVPLTPALPQEAVARLVERRAAKPTLFVLPKWDVAPRPDHQGWDAAFGRLDRSAIDAALRKVADARIGWSKGDQPPVDIEGLSVPAPTDMQWINDADPAEVVDAAGHAIVAKMRDQPHYILTDPDFLNNKGIADRTRAAAALRLLHRLQGDDGAVMFDLTLLGAGSKLSLQKLLVEPPFLALTLALIAAAALAIARGLIRFGPPLAENRAIAFGKSALADTTARLYRRAGRLGALGERYAVLMRQRAGIMLGAPTGLSPDALDAWLDRHANDGDATFSALAAQTTSTRDEPRLHAAARALNEWIQRRKRDS